MCMKVYLGYVYSTQNVDKGPNDIFHSQPAIASISLHSNRREGNKGTDGCRMQQITLDTEPMQT